MAQLDDSGIAARPGGEAWPQILEQPVRDGLVLEPALDQAAGMEVAAARQRDQPFGVGPQRLGLGLGRHHPVVAEQAGRQVRQQRLAVAGGARELLLLGAVAHYSGTGSSLAFASGAEPPSRPFNSPPPSSNSMPTVRPF